MNLEDYQKEMILNYFEQVEEADKSIGKFLHKLSLLCLLEDRIREINEGHYITEEDFFNSQNHGKESGK